MKINVFNGYHARDSEAMEVEQIVSIRFDNYDSTGLYWLNISQAKELVRKLNSNIKEAEDVGIILTMKK